MKEKMKIAVAMSGGVDSTVTAYLLQQKGYDVSGLHMNLWAAEDDISFIQGKQQNLDRLHQMAEMLKIPLHIVDLKEDFRTRVVDRFIDDYSQAKTPNPCIECNRFIKFGALLDKAIELGYDKLATGHYSRVVELENERRAIQQSRDDKKNQSYYLYGLSQKALEKIMFPLGEYTKPEVRAIARSLGLAIADGEESQEICFIPDDDYRRFLETMGVKKTAGRFLDRTGKVLGHHSGRENFTIGQRKGLGISHSEPLYVLEIKDDGDIIVGPVSETVVQTVLVEDLSFQGLDPAKFNGNSGTSGIPCLIQVRYRSRPVQATLFRESSDQNQEKQEALARVHLHETVHSAAPGQSAVFYINSDSDPLTVMGGGIIISFN